MSGYELIKNSSCDDIKFMTGVPDAEAMSIKVMTREELEQLECICPEMMRGINYDSPCRKDQAICHECRKEFLDAEI